MDLTNTLAAAVQLVPSPIMVNYIRISTGSGAILQTLYGEEIWGYLAMTSDNVKMTGYQYITNTAPTTFQSCDEYCTTNNKTALFANVSSSRVRVLVLHYQQQDSTVCQCVLL